ncbi:MAG: hypothetical protein LBG08_05880 [Spirochaetaceae bacterium]|jgi:hypothetical protein|nr:hypothetical protein [Spirochaetaceae bacterium]
MGIMHDLPRFYRSCILFFLICAGLTGFNRAWAQDGPEVFYPPGMAPDLAGPGGTQAAEPPAENSAGTGKLPRVFRNIRLGMGLDELKTALRGDGLFNFRGDRDVSFLPSQARSRGTAGEQSLVETTGSSFIRRAFFQLRGGELFIMAFALDTGLVDHYSVFTGFVEKYGEPGYLDPKQAVWETGTTRISIERPLTVKYIDMRVFNDIIGESALVESGEVRRRQEFLDEF